MTDLATMFGAGFMQSAAIALGILAVVAAVVGVALNLRDLEFMSDGLVHAVFPGIVIGFVLGGNDGVYSGAVVAAVIATTLLTISAHRGVGADATIAVLLAGAFALGIVIVSRTTSYASGLESLLFGRLLTIGPDDLIAIAVLGGIALVLVIGTWKEQVFVSFDKAGARAAGLPVLAIELALNLAIALVVVAASRAVGNLLVLAILIVPPAIGRLCAARLGPVLAIALGSAIVTSLIGLAAGYWLSVDARIQVSPSAVLVLALVGLYLVIAAIVSLARRMRSARATTGRGLVAGVEAALADDRPARAEDRTREAAE